FQGHFLGYIVRQLREMRMNGASSYQLMSHLQKYFPDSRAMAARYLNYAFMGQGLRLMGILRMGKWEDYGPDDEMWPMADAAIDDAPAQWIRTTMPELMRVRDYLAFLEISRDEGVVLTVCAANPAAEKWIGRADARCYAGQLFVPSRAKGPDAGLLAVDPADTRVETVLLAYGGISYADYIARLSAEGYRVLGPEAGHVLVDRDDRRVHEGYRLHGVYDAKTYEPVWTAKRGEPLRAALNRRLGEELVRFGPHDQWERRNDPQIAGPLAGPQLPAIEFSQGGKMRNILSSKELAQEMPYSSRWSELYPDNPIPRGA
ncbi:MAG: hypothetical protein JWM82_2130, partial [Myxococcales bacterium]|nr:hypothetical protein [Myxococcales bacterium]